jgi:hypothetical protein
VIGVPDADEGQVPIACAVFEPGCQATEQEIKDFLAGQIAVSSPRPHSANRSAAARAFRQDRPRGAGGALRPRRPLASQDQADAEVLVGSQEIPGLRRHLMSRQLPSEQKACGESQQSLSELHLGPPETPPEMQQKESVPQVKPEQHGSPPKQPWPTVKQLSHVPGTGLVGRIMAP